MEGIRLNEQCGEEGFPVSHSKAKYVATTLATT